MKIAWQKIDRSGLDHLQLSFQAATEEISCGNLRHQKPHAQKLRVRLAKACSRRGDAKFRDFTVNNIDQNRTDARHSEILQRPPASRITPHVNIKGWPSTIANALMPTRAQLDRYIETLQSRAKETPERQNRSVCLPITTAKIPSPALAVGTQANVIPRTAKPSLPWPRDAKLFPGLKFGKM